MRLQVKIRLILYLIALFLPTGIKAQSVQHSIDQAKVLIDDGKYKEGYKILQGVSETQVTECGESCIMMFNYEKGTCLYYLGKYEEAIPCLQRSLEYMEKRPHEDCNYLEMLYGIGSCYKKLGKYSKAEDYYRKVILKGTYFSLNCAIRNQTYGDMAELYNKMGMPEFADICTSRIKSEMRIRDTKNLDVQIDNLYDLYRAYDKQGKIDESIAVLRKILRTIDENKGKINDDYLLYASILGLELRYSCKKSNEAASIHKEMIEIGKYFKTYREDVCNAYENYLRYLSENNKVDSINIILPAAIKYYKSTKHKDGQEINLYEEIGIGLCEADNFKEGIKYLEREWNGNSANSIRALTCLGTYYSDTDPQKAISYYKKAESQFVNGTNTNDATKQSIYETLIYLSQKTSNIEDVIQYSELLEPFILNSNNKEYYINHLMNWASNCANISYQDKALSIVDKAIPYINEVPDEVKIKTYSNIGFVYLKSEKNDKAIEYIEKGINLAKLVIGDKCADLVSLYHNLGRAYMLKGNYSQALSNLNKSKLLQMELYGEVMQRTSDYIKECEAK